MPAPWFLEADGAKQGPYTSQQIMKLLMDGALKVESKIFDSTANVWKLAADVIPYLELNTKKPAAKATKSGWNPPPRPTELRDVHVVNLNSEATNGGTVDYFALINNQQKSIEKIKVASRTQTSREVEEERTRKAQASRALSREALTAARRAEATKIVRVAPPLETPIAASIISNESVSQKVGMDGILIAEEAPRLGLGLGNVLILARRVRRVAREHKSALSVAASLAFVFASTYGVVRMMSGPKGREPANTVVEAAKPAGLPQLKAPITAPSAIDDELGSGRNRIKRASGAVAYVRTPESSYPRVIPTMPPNPNLNNPSRGDAPRDPPQYYNSEDQQGQQPVVPQSPAPAGDYNGNQVNTDPNSGVVNPPVAPQPNDPNQPSPQNTY